jgi:hypothetical protein
LRPERLILNPWRQTLEQKTNPGAFSGAKKVNLKQWCFTLQLLRLTLELVRLNLEAYNGETRARFGATEAYNRIIEAFPKAIVACCLEIF